MANAKTLRWERMTERNIGKCAKKGVREVGRSQITSGSHDHSQEFGFDCQHNRKLSEGLWFGVGTGSDVT